MKSAEKIISVILAVMISLSVLCVPGYASDDFKPYENSRWYTCGDYKIHYRTEPAKGEFKGRILMLHGFLCSTYAWRNMTAELTEKGYECVMLDLPGFGYSTRETKDTEIIEREEIVISFMESIAPTGSWILAGHSMGGGVAVNIAERVPVKALLLYCPCAQSEFPAAAKSICTSKPMEAFMNFFFKYGTKAEFLVKLVIYAATNDWKFAMDYDISGVAGPVQYDGFGAGMCEMMYNVIPTDLDSADSIKCPVLLVEAEKDIILNDTQKEEMMSAFPGAELFVSQGAGHQCIENRAGELCGVTVDFLTKNGI